MEILHLLPAALETLFSVYWLNACDFCTIDVNNTTNKTKHRSLAETKACSHSRECEICSSTNKFKALFFVVESTVDLPPV